MGAVRAPRRTPHGGPGGLLNGTKAGKEATAALRKDAEKYTWAAAAIGAQNAASYQLASGEPVMPIGGFNGSDPSPTLAKFQEYVRTGKVHYFIGDNDSAAWARGRPCAAAARAAAPAAPSRPGSRPTSGPRRSAEPRSTT